MTHGETATDTARGADDAGRGLAVLMVLAGALLALPCGSAAISLVREQLHISCGMGPPGSEGAETWTCSDGIGYLGVAFTLGGMWFLALLLGSLFAGVIHRGRAARIALVLLAVVATGWVLGWTWYGSSLLVDDAYSPLTGPEYWTAAIGPAALASAVALGAALVSLVFTGRAARIMCAGAAIGLVVATVLQPGLGVLTLPAAGLLAAASVRAAGV